MSQNNFTAEVAAWDLMIAGLKAHQDDLPHLESFLVQLEGTVSALRALQITRDALALESLQGTQNFQAGFAQAKELALRLRSGLIGQYGYRSDTLSEFGIKPSGKRRRTAGAHRNPTAP
jgi:hypothetical protein